MSPGSCEIVSFGVVAFLTIVVAPSATYCVKLDLDLVDKREQEEYSAVILAAVPGVALRTRLAPR